MCRAFQGYLFIFRTFVSHKNFGSQNRNLHSILVNYTFYISVKLLVENFLGKYSLQLQIQIQGDII